jgi:hypothetical protein
MPDERCRLGSDDVVIGLDLASAEHQVGVLTADGQRLTRFRIQDPALAERVRPIPHCVAKRSCPGGPFARPGPSYGRENVTGLIGVYSLTVSRKKSIASE